jgi:Resolvase, N terminal domain
MTELLCSPKIKPEHLARKAIVYLRQSSEKQVRYNLESQRLQYEVADRIRNLGWRDVEIIDSDLGFSAGMASARREGFERVLSWVALGEVGIVGSREVSRLSRTDKDWCRLLEVCQIFGTLIADEQQISCRAVRPMDFRSFSKSIRLARRKWSCREPRILSSVL